MHKFIATLIFVLCETFSVAHKDIFSYFFDNASVASSCLGIVSAHNHCVLFLQKARKEYTHSEKVNGIGPIPFYAIAGHQYIIGLASEALG